MRDSRTQVESQAWQPLETSDLIAIVVIIQKPRLLNTFTCISVTSPRTLRDESCALWRLGSGPQRILGKASTNTDATTVPLWSKGSRTHKSDLNSIGSLYKGTVIHAGPWCWGKIHVGSLRSTHMSAEHWNIHLISSGSMPPLKPRSVTQTKCVLRVAEKGGSKVIEGQVVAAGKGLLAVATGEANRTVVDALALQWFGHKSFAHSRSCRLFSLVLRPLAARMSHCRNMTKLYCAKRKSRTAAERVKYSTSYRKLY